MPSDNTTPTTLATDLRRLGLNRTAEDLNDIIATATRKRWATTALLEHIVAAELEDRQRRSVERRLTCARLGRFKPLADWDWNWPTALDRPALERILNLDFLAHGENVILVGAQGLGKTMLAKNIAHQAILAGHSALFTTAADLLLDLSGQETARALERRLKHYTRPALVAIDEGRLPRLRCTRRRPHLPARQSPLRAPLPADHHQPALQALGHRLPQRLLRRRPDRPPDPPRRDPRHRGPELSSPRGRAHTAAAQPQASVPQTGLRQSRFSVNTVDDGAENVTFRRSTTACTTCAWSAG